MSLMVFFNSNVLGPPVPKDICTCEYVGVWRYMPHWKLHMSNRYKHIFVIDDVESGPLVFLMEDFSQTIPYLSTYNDSKQLLTMSDLFVLKSFHEKEVLETE